MVTRRFLNVSISRCEDLGLISVLRQNVSQDVDTVTLNLVCRQSAFCETVLWCSHIFILVKFANFINTSILSTRDVVSVANVTVSRRSWDFSKVSILSQSRTLKKIVWLTVYVCTSVSYAEIMHCCQLITLITLHSCYVNIRSSVGVPDLYRVWLLSDVRWCQAAVWTAFLPQVSVTTNMHATHKWSILLTKLF